MIVRYPCSHPDCRWFHDRVATPRTANVPTDILTWTPANWDAMAERTGPGLAAAHIIDGHLVTHSPVQWMAMVYGERQRTESVMAERDRLRIVVEKLMFLADAVDPLSTQRLPSRAEVEATRELLAGVLNGGAADV